MALPVPQAVGTPLDSTTGGAVPWPAHQADDIALLWIETSNSDTVTFSDAAGFVAVTGFPQGTGGSAGTGGECKLSLYWCRATSGSMASPTINDSGNHQYAVITTYRGCITTGNPWDVVNPDFIGTGSTAISIPGGTTTVADCLIVAGLAHGRDNAGPQVTSAANADLAGFAEQFDNATAGGHGGGIFVATGQKATAGTYGATTGTLGASAMQSRVSIALKPPAPAGDATGSGTPSSTLSSSAAGAATQKFTGSGTPSSTLSSSAEGEGTNTPDDSTGSGTPSSTLSSSAAGAGAQKFTGSGTPTDTIGSTAAGAGAQKFTGSGTPTDTLSSTADGDGTMTTPQGDLPFFTTAGVPASGQGTISPAWPAHVAGDIGLLLIETSNAGTTSLSDAQGFVEVDGSPQGIGDGTGASGECRLAAYWCRATSGSMAAPTVADSGNHQYAVILGFRGCVEEGDPWDVTAGDTGAASTAISIPGLTTTGANRLIAAIVAHGRDNVGPQVSGFANAGLTNFSEVFDNSVEIGHGGGIAVAVGEKATQGAVGATTATLTAANMQARLTIAFKGAIADPSDVAGTGDPSSTLSSSAAGTSVHPVLIATTDNWATKISANPAGTVFLVEAGVHRFASCNPKANMVFLGEGSLASIMRGARELTGWTPDGSGNWFVTGQTQQNTAFNPNFSLQAGHPGGYLPEQLWVDGVLYEHMTSLTGLTGQQWYFDYDNDRIYLPDDPGSALVETSVTTHAFGGTSSGVTIQNLIVEKYANEAQKACVNYTNGANDWKIIDCEIRHNHGTGVAIDGAGIIRGCYVHHQGQMGIKAFGPGGLVEDNEIAFNNTAFFGPGVFGEAGGTKFVGTSALVVRGNYSHDNDGPGLWTDIDNINTLYEDNLVEDNKWRGIFHEISYAAVIRNNIVRRNGHAFPGTLGAFEGSGILISNSPDVEVYGNLVENNRNGIMAREEDRGSGNHGPYNTANLYVHDNIVIQPDGRAGGVTDTDATWDPYTVAANNRWEANTYVLGPAADFRWSPNVDYTIAQWLAIPQDAGATFNDFVGSGSPTSTLSSSATGAGTQTFLGEGAPTDSLSSTVAGAVSQVFTGSGSGSTTLVSVVVSRALQADFMGEGALTYTLDSEATGEGGTAQDAFTGEGAPSMFVSSSVAGVASQKFSGSGTPAGSLSSTVGATADQEGFAGPTVVGVTPPLASTADREIVWPGSHSDPELSDIEVGDIGILFVATKNQVTTAVTPGAADSAGDTSNFVQVTGTTGNGAGTAGAADAVRLGARWCRATSHHMRSVILPDPGEVVMAGMVVVRGCRAVGDPWDAVAIHVVDPASTSILIPGVTTSLANVLIVQAAQHAIDTTAFASNNLVNATLQNLTVLTERSSQAGPGGLGMVFVSGEKLIAGEVDDTTGTWDSSTRSAAVTIALRGEDPPTNSTGSGTPTDSLSSTVVASATSTPAHNASGALVSTLDSDASGTATRAADVTGSGAVTDTLDSDASGVADSTTIGQVDAFGALVSTISTNADGLCFSQPSVLFPPRPPRDPRPGQGRPPRRVKRILLPEEEPAPRIRRKREKPAPPPIPEAEPLAELPPAPPAFAPVTFDPMLWAAVSAPPVRPQTPVVTQQDIAEEEAFLAQLLDLI